jgi:hypothetical protein
LNKRKLKQKLNFKQDVSFYKILMNAVSNQAYVAMEPSARMSMVVILVNVSMDFFPVIS